MKRFESWDQLPERSLEGMERKIFHGERVMLVRNTIHPHAVLPAHSHPHEQMIYIESGGCDLTVGGQTRHMTAGGLAWVSGGMEHAVVNTEDVPLVALDIFSPIREDFLD